MATVKYYADGMATLLQEAEYYSVPVFWIKNELAIHSPPGTVWRANRKHILQVYIPPELDYRQLPEAVEDLSIKVRQGVVQCPNRNCRVCTTLKRQSKWTPRLVDLAGKLKSPVRVSYFPHEFQHYFLQYTRGF